jgi:hypothetical protein
MKKSLIEATPPVTPGVEVLIIRRYRCFPMRLPPNDGVFFIYEVWTKYSVEAVIGPCITRASEFLFISVTVYFFNLEILIIVFNLTTQL